MIIMKGITSIVLAAVIGAIILLVSIVFSAFTGGSHSDSLFGWQGDSLLSGIDSLVTGVYNGMVFISSWVTIGVMLFVYVGMQGMFLYIYIRVFRVVRNVRRDMMNVLNELLNI